MTTSRLSLYNGALRLLGEGVLGSLTENRPSRYMLDSVWDDGAVNSALEAGQWLFATKSMKYEYSPSVTSEFGYKYAFNKPDDYIRTMAVCEDEYFNSPLIRYADETGFWWSDLQTLYIKYVSNDPAYGGDFSQWPQSFVDFVHANMAIQVAMPLTQNKQKRDDMIAISERALVVAKSQNAMADPVKFPPPSSWVRARVRTWGSGRGFNR